MSEMTLEEALHALNEHRFIYTNRTRDITDAILAIVAHGEACRELAADIEENGALKRRVQELEVQCASLRQERDWWRDKHTVATNQSAMYARLWEAACQRRDALEQEHDAELGVVEAAVMLAEDDGLARDVLTRQLAEHTHTLIALRRGDVNPFNGRK